MSKTGPDRRPTLAFPPASALHGQLEAFARELHDLRARLVRLDAAAGDCAAPLRAPPVRLHDRPEPLDPPAGNPAGTLPPAGAAWWPRAFDTAPRLPTAPGHRCAGLVHEGLPVIAVSCCGLSAEEIVAEIEAVVAEQIKTRAFVALFLTDRAEHLHHFRHQGLDVELVPAEEDLATVPGVTDIATLLRHRMGQIRDTWGISAYRDRGTRPLPWPAEPQEAPRRPEPVVYFYKDYRRHNPYQHLFYLSMPGLSFHPGDIERAASAVAHRPTVFHLNWEEALYRGAGDAAEADARVHSFLDTLDDFLVAGGRLVWTLHNERPHENPFPETHARLAEGIAARCHLAVVHSAEAGRLARERYGVPAERLCEVPHGGYQGVYPADTDRAAARRSLGLPTEGVVFGFIGSVRGYKNVPLLLEAFARLPRGAARLLIAGRQMVPVELPVSDHALGEDLVIRDEFIPDEALSDHVRACDAIVLPFDRVLTSGSMLLALSLAVPVIVPDLPGLRETLDEGVNGLVFPPGDPEALAARMAEVMAMETGEREALAHGAARTARLLEWDWIGRKVARRIRDLFDEETAAGRADGSDRTEANRPEARRA